MKKKKLSKKQQGKFSKVMREHSKHSLHMGRSGKAVPEGRKDIAAAIAYSEARKA